MLINLIEGLLKKNKKRKIKREIKKDIQEINDEIKLVREQICKTDIWFKNEENQDLIDACLYQRELLNARYRYLLKKARKLYDKK